MKQTVSAKQEVLSANLRDGEVYGGIVLGADGEPDYHLFAQTKFIESATFDEVKKYVEKVGGVGATRRDLALLRVNAPKPFGARAFWSCEQHAAYSYYAWYQNFDNGYQYNGNLKSCRLCGVAVRRLEIF